MPNIAAVLKEEIRRLARKEIKSHMVKTRRATARYRSDIAGLKRALRLQERKLVDLAAKQGKDAEGAGEAEEAGPKMRFSARSVRAQRRRLKLSAQQYAKLVGVSAQTVYLWERGKTRPKRAQFAALVAARTLGRRQALQQLDALRPKRKTKRK